MAAPIIQFKKFISHKPPSYLERDETQIRNNFVNSPAEGFSDLEYEVFLRVLRVFSKNPKLLEEERFYEANKLGGNLFVERFVEEEQERITNHTQKMILSHLQRKVETIKSLKKVEFPEIHKEIETDPSIVGTSFEPIPGDPEIEMENNDLTPQYNDINNNNNSTVIVKEAAEVTEKVLSFRCAMCLETTMNTSFEKESKICAECTELTKHKVDFHVDLRTRIAIVTGGRAKIGFQTALKLLRCGCHVIVTTRNPWNALANYIQEKDFSEWKDRLDIYFLDCRVLSNVEQFVAHMHITYPYLDILINSTICSHDGYKNEKGLETEEICKESISKEYWNMVKSYSMINSNVQELSDQLSQLNFKSACTKYRDMSKKSKDRGTDMLHQVASIEVVAAFHINALAPFILASQLQALFVKSPHKYRFIVNVSSQTGQFYKLKSPHHPHKNASKASMNMMTRTSALQYTKQFNIIMNSVDPGWVPETTITNGPFSITAVESAARILDPIFQTISSNNERFLTGKFFQNFREALW